MFFIGSLTTIMPYLGTIILMLVFHLAGTPTKDFVISSTEETGQHITLEQTSTNAVELSSSSICYYQSQVTLSKASFTQHVTCYILADLQHRYHSRISLADSNKAPPSFI